MPQPHFDYPNGWKPSMNATTSPVPQIPTPHPLTNSGYPQFNLMSINQSLDQHSGNYWVPAWAPLIDERKIHHWAPLAAYTTCRFHLEVVAAFDSHAATSSSDFSRVRLAHGNPTKRGPKRPCYRRHGCCDSLGEEVSVRRLAAVTPVVEMSPRTSESMACLVVA